MVDFESQLLNQLHISLSWSFSVWQLKRISEMHIINWLSRLHSTGATLRRYPTSKGKEAQQEGRHWSGGGVVLERLWGDTPCPRAKGKPKQGGAKSWNSIRIKPHTHQRCSEDSNKPWVHKVPETPKTLRKNCVWVSPVEYGSAVPNPKESIQPQRKAMPKNAQATANGTRLTC